MKKILVIGANIPTGLMLQKLKEEHGNDIEIFTIEEAEKNGMKLQDFANIPTYTIHALPPIMDLPFYPSAKVGKGGRARNRSKFKK